MFEKFIVNFAIPEKKFFGTLIAVFIVLSFIFFILLTYNITSERFVFWDLEIIQILQSYTFLTVPLVIVSSFGQLSVSILFFLLYPLLKRNPTNSRKESMLTLS